MPTNKKTSILSFCESYLFTYVYMHVGQNGVSGPLKQELQEVVRHPAWVLEPNFGPLQEQQAFLTTETSPQLPTSLILI